MRRFDIIREGNRVSQVRADGSRRAGRRGRTRASLASVHPVERRLARELGRRPRSPSPPPEGRFLQGRRSVGAGPAVAPARVLLSAAFHGTAVPGGDPKLSTGGELVLQRAVRAVARATLRRGDGPPVDPRGLRRVLVVRTDDRVGNVLLTTPLLRALREGLPHVRIDFLLSARRQALVDGLFLADRLVPWDKRRAARNPVAFSAFLMSLRSADYDAVIDAAHYDAFSLTAALFTRWTGAPVRIGHDRGDAAHYYSHAVPVPEQTRYDVAVKLGLLGPLGLPPRGHLLETSAGTSSDAVGDVASMLGALELERGRYFVVNPGARKLDRRVSPERLAQVIRRIAGASGLKALVVWGPGEEALAQDLVSAARPAARLAPATDLHQLAAVLRRAALLVTNDTGPMHLGVACGAPVLALFTMADSARWGHPLPTFHALEHADDLPDLEHEAERWALRLLERGTR